MKVATGTRRILCRSYILTCSILVFLAATILPGTASANFEEEYLNARTFYNARDYTKSLDILDRILAPSNLSNLEDSQQLEAQILRARCLTKMDREDEAITAYCKVLAINGKWQPDSDPVLQQPDEVAAFNKALTKYKAEHEFAVAPVDSQSVENKYGSDKYVPPRECPSSTIPLIATGVCAATTAYYFLGARPQTDDSWDEYADDPDHPVDLYDEYQSANDREYVLGWVSIGTAAVSAGLWVMYILNHKDCTADNAQSTKVSLSVAPGYVVLGCRF